MKIVKITCFVFLLFLCSCEVFTRQHVKAGKFDTDFFYNEYTPPLIVDLNLDSTTNYLLGSDSIDLNQDGIFDIIIKQRIETENRKGKVGKDYYTYCALFLKDGLEIATRTQEYGVSHGYTGTALWVDTLNYNDRIDKSLNWLDSNTNEIMWLKPTAAQDYPRGCWYDVKKEEMFVGIKMKHNSNTKYGWIKINAVSRKNMQFINSAIEK